jgi:hypothetical protein
VLVELFAVEADDAIAASLLGHVERVVCRPHQRLAVPNSGVRPGRDAEARRAAEGTTFERERVLLHFLTHTLGKRHSGVQDGPRQEEHELLASISTDSVDLPGLALEDMGELFEDGIPGLVAVRVVDALEAVEIHHHARDLLVQSLPMLPHLPQPLLDVAAVVEPGQSVRLRHVPQPLVDFEEFALALLECLLEPLDPQHGP